MNEITMIYGAYGYTGRLVAARAVAAGLRVILAGRDAAKLAEMGADLGLEHTAFALDDDAMIGAELAKVAAVIHCAGPFCITSRPMLAACLKAGVHYLDITGEVGVLAACAGLDHKARAAKITVMPGCGFDVVPTDCMAAMLAEKLPDATRLQLAFGGLERASQGTMRTATMFITAPTYHRKDNKLVPRQAAPTTMVDFGAGPEQVYATTWGDIETAAHSTGIKNIDVFMKPSREMEASMRLPGFVRKFLGTRLGAKIMQARISRLPAGPNEAEREQGRGLVTGTVWNDAGESVTLHMRTAEPYDLTARTAVEIAGRVVLGKVPVGFQTPSMAFGAGFILEIKRSEMIN